MPPLAELAEGPVNLFRVYEVIRADVAGGEVEIIQRGWAPSKNQISRFWDRSAITPVTNRSVGDKPGQGHGGEQAAVPG